MDETTDPAQPVEGQGETGDSPWASYLERFPEEVRDEAASAFREMEANTTRKFEQQAEYRKGWEPFEQLGVKDRDPAAVEWALQVADAAQNDPAAFQQWFEQTYAPANGLTPAQQLDQEFEDPTAKELRELKAQFGQVTGQLGELSEWRSSQEQQRAQAEQMQGIEAELTALEKKHPDEYNRTMIEMFVDRQLKENPSPQDGPQVVRAAFADWQKARNDLEKDFLQSKADVPAPAEHGGNVNSAGEVDNSLKTAGIRALEQMRAHNQS